MATIEMIMDLVFIAFAVYGTFVLHKWRKCAEQVEKMMDDLEKERETWHETD